MRSVECYGPTTDIWSLVAELFLYCDCISIGVLNGVMYVKWCRSSEYYKRVEAYKPSAGGWYFIADMHLSRYKPGKYYYYLFYKDY